MRQRQLASCRTSAASHPLHPADHTLILGRRSCLAKGAVRWSAHAIRSRSGVAGLWWRTAHAQSALALHGDPAATAALRREDWWMQQSRITCASQSETPQHSTCPAGTSPHGPPLAAPGTPLPASGSSCCWERCDTVLKHQTIGFVTPRQKLQHVLTLTGACIAHCLTEALMD